MPSSIPSHDFPPSSLPSQSVDAFFGPVVRNVHARLARREQEGIPAQPTFTISETAALTGNDEDEIRYWVRHGEIPSISPTGMQRLIPREEVLRLMPASATQEST